MSKIANKLTQEDNKQRSKQFLNEPFLPFTFAHKTNCWPYLERLARNVLCSMTRKCDTRGRPNKFRSLNALFVSAACGLLRFFITWCYDISFL